MLRRRRGFSVSAAPLCGGDAAWQPLESCVVSTSVSMYRKLQDPQTASECPLQLVLDNKAGSHMDRWGEAGSPTEPVPHKDLSHQLGLLPTVGRLLKSESEDSGVEMASNDQSPSSPVGSEKSFSLDCVNSFQPSVDDPVPLVPHESCLKEEEPQEPDPAADGAYHRNLSVSKKLAQVVQRSQNHNLPHRSPRHLSQRPCSLVNLEVLKSYRLHHPVSVDGKLDADAREYSEALSNGGVPKEYSTEKEVQDEPWLTMPGHGLRYLEHICQMLEKIAQLQRANMRLQHQHQVMECRLRAQELENEALSEEPTLTKVENQLECQVETEEREDPNSLDSWHRHHFRARSASDTGMRLSPVHNSGNKPDQSKKAAVHSASSPNLLDQPDGCSRTLPPGMKLKNDHSHWGKVKVLINRITRKSVRTNDPATGGEPAPSSGQCGADAELNKPESHSRRRFLPTLGAKKRRSKHLSMR